MAAKPPKSWDLEEIRRVLTAAVARACPPALADAREDIVQAAMIKVMRILEENEETGIRTASYLWRVGYTATVNEIRARRRRREEPMDTDTAAEPGRASGPDPERAARSRELGRGIRDCLLTLIEPRRLAVLLKLHGYGLKESAKVLGWDSKRVDNLLYRGMADLRKCLSAKGLEP